MMPINQINIGDMFQNPLFPDGNIYVVEDINKEEKMIKVQAYSSSSYKPILKSFWKKNTDRMFSENWRI